ncbi:hypothetical protein AOR13_1032 [Alteromonas stellipolaris LMG 21856]|nr:hypothetical protein AOR13_1032 [Alteromonas stellipolaris LMG 21856]
MALKCGKRVQLFILIIDSACARMKMPYQYRFSILLTAIFYLY